MDNKDHITYNYFQTQQSSTLLSACTRNCRVVHDKTSLKTEHHVNCNDNMHLTKPIFKARGKALAYHASTF